MMYSLIIADDDELILKGLEKVIPWRDLGFSVVSTFSNGYEAFLFIKSHPVDAILTDVKMPKMNGLELVAEAKKLNASCKAVVISGFSEFELVKNALTLKVEDYLLKPLAEEDVVKVFKKVRIELDKDRWESTYNANELSQCYLLVKKFRNEFRYLSGLVQSTHGKISYRLILVACPSSPGIQSKMEQILGNEMHAFEGDYLLLLARNTKRERILEELQKLISCYSAKIVVGNDVYWGDDVLPAFWNAYDLLAVTMPGTTTRYSEKKGDDPLQLARFFLQPLAATIEEGRKDALNVFLESMINRIQALEPTDQSYVYCALFIKLLRYFGMEEQMDSFGSTTFSHETPEHLRDAFLADIQALTRTLSAKGDSRNKILIKQTKAIVERDVGDPSISLSSVAEELGISAGYLSSLFSKSEGKTFKSFLIAYRMDQARLMLLSRKWKIYEISGKVGYSNTKYFTEAFHKYYGCSPMEYLQKLHGSVEA